MENKDSKNITDGKLQQVTGGCFYSDGSDWKSDYQTTYRPQLVIVSHDFIYNDKSIILWFIGELDALNGDILTVQPEFDEIVNSLRQKYFSIRASLT